MILRRLYEYAQSHAEELPPEGMEWKEIEYVIVLGNDGKFVRFESRRIDKKRCAQFLVPTAVIRTCGIVSNALWDNRKYVLGKDKDGEEALGAFTKVVNETALHNPAHPTVKAIQKFYTLPCSIRDQMMSKDVLYEEVINNGNAYISFRLLSDDRLVTEDPLLFKYIREATAITLKKGICSITGKYGPIVRTTTPTPFLNCAATAALVACNEGKGFDSYGKSQVYNSPISMEAENAISRVLKKFLGKESSNKMCLGNRMFLFWGSGDKILANDIENGLLGLLQIPDKKEAASAVENIDKVSKLFKSIYSGNIKTTLDDNFHILGLTPNKGRIAVVTWMESSLKEFASKVVEHFDAMEIVDNRKPAERYPYAGVFSIISGATREGKISDALPRVVEETVNAVINGTPYPFPLYVSTLQRIRAELSDKEVNVGRAAFLKAYINRKEKNNNLNTPLSVMLDKNNSNAAYLCGRLTAVLEQLQWEVKSGDSIRTRYMGAASTTPGTVMPSMLNLSLHHSEKLKKERRSFYEKLKEEILEKIPSEGFPATLDLTDQGRFFVGYYHQRRDLFPKSEN